MVGSVRNEDSAVDGESHAWNAIEILKKWYLIDPTWNSGHAMDRYQSLPHIADYLLTPPEVFGLDHFPSRPKWQLREKPLTRGEFIRQPMMSPRFYWQGFELVKPSRSHITVQGTVEIVLVKKSAYFVIASYEKPGQEQRTKCTVDDQIHTAKVRCQFPKPGPFQVLLFSNEERYGTYGFIGKVAIINE